MGIIIYFKEKWRSLCKELELDIDQVELFGGTRILAIEFIEICIIGVYAPAGPEIHLYKLFLFTLN